VRVLIVGVGGVGAMAAWRLAEEGHEVVALERFRIDHDLGSSYGDSRIVRRVYPDPFYTSLMADSYARWDDFTTASRRHGIDTPLLNRCGGLFLGPRDHPQLIAAQGALEASGVPYEVCTANDRLGRYPALRLDADEIGLFEPSMGFAYASRCVRAAVQIARDLGAVVHEETLVAAIEADGAGVAVTTERGERFYGDRLLIAAGAWTGPLLSTLGVTVPLVVTRQVVAHIEPDSPEADFAVGRLPVWIDAAANAYGFPAISDGEVGGVKVALHDLGEPTTADSVERRVTEADMEAVRNVVRRRFNGLSDRILYAKVCLYSNTPDSDFVIDTIPGLPAATFVSACSGHGFKFTPLLGKIACARMTDQETPWDLSRFRLDRFRAEQSVGVA
jgi:sarcosine oxidase